MMGNGNHSLFNIPLIFVSQEDCPLALFLLQSVVIISVVRVSVSYSSSFRTLGPWMKDLFSLSLFHCSRRKYPEQECLSNLRATQLEKHFSNQNLCKDSETLYRTHKRRVP